MHDRRTQSALPRLAPAEEVEACVHFSVIVPVYEHWHLVPALLERLAAQTIPGDRFEVILVDNGSENFAPPAGIAENARIVRCETRGSYAARNEGARYARGAWLAFTDADCLPAPDWLAEIGNARVRCGDRTLIAGPVEVFSASSHPSVWEIYEIVRGIPQSRYVGRGYAATANLAVSRAVFDALGGFDGSRFSGGDADFCRRAGAAGHPIILAERARVGHVARASWPEIATKARRIKGAQLTAGTAWQRLVWLVRTLVFPLRAVWLFLRTTRQPLRHRLIAILVQTRIWTVELGELVRRLLRRPLERR